MEDVKSKTKWLKTLWKNKEKVATGAAATGGIAAAGAGVAAAAIGTTTMAATAGASAAAITAAGAGIGGAVLGTAGAVVGTGVGIVTGGLGIPGTIPLATAGAVAGAGMGAAAATTIAGWLGIPIATTVAVSTAPVWAIPVAVGGAATAVGASIYHFIRKNRKCVEMPKFHIVKKGDTITKIAKIYGTTPDKIAQANAKSLEEMNHIKVGEAILLQ